MRKSKIASKVRDTIAKCLGFNLTETEVGIVWRYKKTKNVVQKEVLDEMPFKEYLFVLFELTSTILESESEKRFPMECKILYPFAEALIPHLVALQPAKQVLGASLDSEKTSVEILDYSITEDRGTDNNIDLVKFAISRDYDCFLSCYRTEKNDFIFYINIELGEFVTNAESNILIDVLRTNLLEQLPDLNSITYVLLDVDSDMKFYHKQIKRLTDEELKQMLVEKTLYSKGKFTTKDAAPKIKEMLKVEYPLLKEGDVVSFLLDTDTGIVAKSYSQATCNSSDLGNVISTTFSIKNDHRALDFIVYRPSETISVIFPVANDSFELYSDNFLTEISEYMKSINTGTKVFLIVPKYGTLSAKFI